MSSKRRSFELFRRNLTQPEILTFDELFERARFIIENTSDVKAKPDIDEDEIPF
jgi:hypothetical protein